jgi:hypothetical protein
MNEEIESYQTSKGDVTISIEIHILQKLTYPLRETNLCIFDGKHEIKGVL